jgi:hypothetical protein
MKDAQNAASALKDSLDALNGVHISAAKAAIDVQDKISNLTKALHDNGNTLDITTQAGRDNMNAILDAADAANKHAEAVTSETGSVYAGNAALQVSRDEFDKVLAQAHLTTAQIQNFNDTILNLPKVVPIVIVVDDGSAVKKLQQFKDSAGNLSTVHIGGTTGKAAYATGGYFRGAGTTTSDSNNVAISDKEYIFSAKATAKYGVAALDRMNFGGGIPTVVKPQLAGGGGGGGYGPSAGTAAAGAAVQMSFAAGADQALATVIMNLYRNKKIQFVTAAAS